MQEKKHVHKQSSDEASETDCSTELIPQVLQGNKLTHVPKPSMGTHANNNMATKKPQDKQEMNKKEPSSVFTDSSLSDTDSDTCKTVKGGGAKTTKTVGDEEKTTPKKKTVKKTIQEQVTASADKPKGKLPYMGKF